MAAAEVALERHWNIVVHEDRAERTRDHTLAARDAFLGVALHHSVVYSYGIGGAVLPALGLRALPTHDRHPDDGVRIERYHADRRLLGVADAEMLERAGRLAQPTARAPLGHNAQSLRHGCLLPRVALGRGNTRLRSHPPPSSEVVLPSRDNVLAGAGLAGSTSCGCCRRGAASRLSPPRRGRQHAGKASDSWNAMPGLRRSPD